MLRSVVYKNSLRYLQTSSSILQTNSNSSNITSSSSQPNVTFFRFPKSKQQLLEEQENPDLKIKPSGYTAKLLKLNPIKRIDLWMDMKLSPDINQRRSEIWFGFWETWDTCMIAGRHWRRKRFDSKFRRFQNNSKSLFKRKRVDAQSSERALDLSLTYKEMMQIDRAKREFPKLLIAVGPFMVIPGSLAFWFPCLIVLASAFPSYLMPAHYMRGKSAKNYYGIIHRRRSQNYDTVLKNFNLVRNNRFCPARVDTILTDLHRHNLPDPNEIINLYSWIQKENTMHTTNVPKEVITAYAKMLLGWMPILGIFQPRGLREYYLNKRLTKIFEMDRVLRKDDHYKNLTRGQLREALFIRGVNGFEENLTRQATLFWLENWLKISESIENKSKGVDNDTDFLMTDSVASSYKLLSLFIWSANFRYDTYLNYVKKKNFESEKRANGEIMDVDTVSCPHCGFDCTDIVHQRVKQELLIQQAETELEKRFLLSRRDKNILKNRLTKLKRELQ